MCMPDSFKEYRKTMSYYVTLYKVGSQSDTPSSNNNFLTKNSLSQGLLKEFPQLGVVKADLNKEHQCAKYNGGPELIIWFDTDDKPVCR